MIVAADRCPEPEILAQFAEGTVDSATRTEVARHISTCAECPIAVGEAVRFLRDRKARSARRRWSLALAATLAVMIPAVLWRLFASDPFVQVRERVASADQRLIEGRLEGFPWAPFQIQRSEQRYTIDLELEAAARRVLRNPSRDPAALHQRGVALLILGQNDEAVAVLRDAVAVLPQNAGYWNDLAVAWIEHGDATAGEALGASDRAIELSPGFAEAHFNRAVALERLRRFDEALSAYRRAEAATSAALWREEIRARIQRLDLAR